MLTLEQAIAHCKQKARELNIEASEIKHNSDNEIKECEECAKEHEQLAKWLKELKELREANEQWKKLQPLCACEGIIIYKIKENKE